eukprot:IDg14525t1
MDLLMDPRAKFSLCFARSFIRLHYVGRASLNSLSKRSNSNLRYVSACARGATLNKVEPSLNPSEANLQSRSSDEESFFHPSATFESLGLSPQLCDALKNAGILRPTQVQVETIPRLLNGLECQIEYAQTLRTAEKELKLLEATDDPESESPDGPELPEPLERDVDDVLMVGAET